MTEELELFLEDMDEQLSIMEQTLLDISEISIEEIDKEMINKLFRAMHTMKGNAGMFGYDVITEFAHIAENLLDEIRNNSINITQEILDLFLLVHDHSKILVEVFTQDKKLDEEQNKHHAFLLKELEKYLVKKTETEINLINDSLLETTYNIDIVLKNDFFKSGMDILSILKYLNAIGEVLKVEIEDDKVPEINEINPLIAYLSLKITYKTDEDKSEIFDAFEFVMEDIELDVIEVESIEKVEILPLKEIEESIKTNIDIDIEKQLTIPEKEITPKPIEIDEKSYTLKVNSSKIDKLINQISEMVIANAKISQFTLSSKNSELEESVTIMSEMLEEVRNGIMNIRMVQVGDSLAKLRRVVSEIARKTNKEIDFEIIGGETELDKMVIEKITDPLVHMLRNSIDHGIELPSKRLELGKSEEGHITLKAYPDSGSIVIKISDDGAGLDKEQILKKAVEKGLVKEKNSLNEKEIFNLIFAAGFSTSQTISDISGRGVGMDVVKKNIESLRGSVEIESELNIGTTITIRLPLTLAIINGFLVQSGEVKYIIPVDSIQECIEVTKSRKEQIEKNGYIVLRDIIIPIIDIAEYFKEKKDDSKENIIVVRYGREYVGLKVNTLFGEYQTVIKPLGGLLENVNGISGGTILGNGEIALIFDIQELIKYKIENEEFKYGN